MDKQLKELNNYKNRLSVALRAAKVCIFEVDVKKQLYTYFENSEAIFGVSGEKILNDVRVFSKLPADEYQRKVTEYFVHEDDCETVARAFELIISGKPASYTARMKAGKTGYVWCKIDVTPLLQEDGSIKMVGIITDIQNIYNKIDFLSHELKLDAFTKLYSKQAFKELSIETLEKFPDEKAAVIIFDLDNFKHLNDTFGHQVGDEVLLSVSNHLKKAFCKHDIVARFGGDEFVVLMRNISSEKDAVEKIKRLIGERDNNHGVTKSAGISFYPESAENYDELLAKADRALYESKKVKNTYSIG